MIKHYAKIFLITKDEVKIAANLYPAESPKGWIVFSHMMPAVKESWNDLAEIFCGAGYESIAIDLRGTANRCLTAQCES